MALMKQESSSHEQDLLQAHDELLHMSLGYAKSLALAVAMDLRIPDAIHRHDGGATLSQILAETALHPSKLRALRRLMRVLTVTGTFGVQQPPAAGGDDDDDSAAVVYTLTAASRFLVSDELSTTTLAPYVSLALHPIAVSPHAMGICAWFRQEQKDPSPYSLAFSQNPTIWEHDDDVNALLNKGMVAGSRFVMPTVLRDCGDVFRGIDSLVDVGGGHGGAAAAIAAAFPHLKCSVLDLPHVVASAPTDGNVEFVGGNMFQSIPPANAVFLKTTLHDWGDDECVRILKNCREAIPPRDAGGKVIILDVVVGYDQSNIKHLETQVMFDLYMMAVNGVERDEQEWKKLFTEAGFKDYKILPVIGAVSVIIEVYP